MTKKRKGLNSPYNGGKQIRFVNLPWFDNPSGVLCLMLIHIRERATLKSAGAQNTGCKHTADLFGVTIIDFNV